MKQWFFLIALLTACVPASAKSVYIPLYLQNTATVDGAQFSYSKTAQSANFILIWGATVSTNPAAYTADPSLAFVPSKILDTMEFLYTAFKASGFLNDSAGTRLAQYKIPIVMYGTWGPNGAQGFASGGDADGFMGAFWVHPTAMLDGGVAAHELCHSLQAQCVIDYRTAHGSGPAFENAGIFWETHANFMRNWIYPRFSAAWGMDAYHIEAWGDWKNTYENYEMLAAIQASEGMGMVNRLWRESLTQEYPLQAYKRLAGYTQTRFNDSVYSHVRRMATMDFPHNGQGGFLRQSRADNLQNHLLSIQGAYDILQPVSGSTTRYFIPTAQAPEEYAYNLIPLHVNPDSCSVIIRFKGQTAANIHAGWRYGFVAAKANGTLSRYSPTYSNATGEIAFALQPGETSLYLMVMGAPVTGITTDTARDTWKGYPKHFRFPYELTITGAVPEGFQTPGAFRPQLKASGHLHPNGGGWVANSATVAASVYVAPYAIVRGTANLSGTVRIEGTAYVENATVSGSVKVQDNAFVTGGIYSGNAVVRGQALAEADTVNGNAIIGMRAKVSNYKLGGTAEVGGDVVVYNTNGACSTGVYYVLTNYYQDNLLPCDGRTASHPANMDVNNAYSPFTTTQMAMACRCALLPNCLSLGVDPGLLADASLTAFPNPTSEHVILRWRTGTGPAGAEVALFDATGRQVLRTAFHDGVARFEVKALPAGLYTAVGQSGGRKDMPLKILVIH